MSSSNAQNKAMSNQYVDMRARKLARKHLGKMMRDFDDDKLEEIRRKNAWEFNFVSDLIVRWERDQPISDKQIARLEIIHGKRC